MLINFKLIFYQLFPDFVKVAKAHKIYLRIVTNIINLCRYLISQPLSLQNFFATLSLSLAIPIM